MNLAFSFFMEVQDGDAIAVFQMVGAKPFSKKMEEKNLINSLAIAKVTFQFGQMTTWWMCESLM